MMAGLPSMVCTKFGFMASLSNAAIAPCAFKSRAYIGCLSKVNPTKILPSLSFKSDLLAERQRMAMISDAAVISNPVSLGIPFPVPPSPTIVDLNARSFISITLFQSTVLGSIPKDLVLD